MDDHAAGEPYADPAAVDAVLTASRSLLAVATRSLGPAAEEGTIPLYLYRALVVLASRGPQRLAELAVALDVTPSAAGRMCDRLVRNGLARRHQTAGDPCAVLVSVTPPGRQVADEAAGRRRVLIAGILARLPVPERHAVARALRAFADAAGEVPDSQWPTEVPTPRGPAPRWRPPAQPGRAARGGARERA